MSASNPVRQRVQPLRQASAAARIPSVRLRQINVDYDAEHDRLLMRIGTNDGAELRLWLTRRFIRLLWPLLVKLAEDASPRIRTQANPEARKALLGLEHEQAISRADFSRPYENKTPSTPLGEAPLLLARVQTGHDRKGQPVVALHPSEGHGVTLNLDGVLLHSLCRLLQAAAQKSDWDIELRLPGTDTRGTSERAQRTIN
jgi:hypothetical protein